MASIREVAKLANVAPSTVSRALNNSGYVAEETREKIKIAVEKLDYLPNQWIRNLYKKNTGLIGVIVPDLSHPFFSVLANEIEHALHQKGYNMILCSTGNEYSREQEYLYTLSRDLFDGVIDGAAMLENEVYMQLNKPIVMLDRLIPNIPLAVTDHKLGGEMAAKIFIDNNCKYVADITGGIKYDAPSYQSHVMLNQVLSTHGIKTRTVIQEWWSTAHFEQCLISAKNLLERHPKIDGLFAADVVAVAFLKEAQKLGKQIPKNIKVVAFDGTFFTKASALQPTCIQQNIKSIAKQSVQLLISKINKRPLPEEIILIEPKLIQGETTIPI